MLELKKIVLLISHYKEALKVKISEMLISNKFLLYDHSITDQVVHQINIKRDQYISYASYLYDTHARELLANLYKQILDVGNQYKIPCLIDTPSRRLQKNRIKNSSYKDRNLFSDEVSFLNDIRDSYGEYSSNILIGGLLSTKGNSYNYAESLSEDEAYTFHQYQITRLATSGVDFLIAVTMPALSEAVGISKAMSETCCEYIISFIVRKDGKLLDGTLLSIAIETIDATVLHPPIFYMINCVHPKNIDSCLNCKENKTIIQRIYGACGNGSRNSVEELEDNNTIQNDSPYLFSQSMINLYHKFMFKVVGGCCGTNSNHLSEIAKILVKEEACHH